MVKKHIQKVKTGLLWLANKEWKRNCGLNILGKNIKFMILENCFFKINNQEARTLSKRHELI